MAVRLEADVEHDAFEVICIAGDGGLMMTGHEIIAAAERRLPILFIVSNNCCYGSIRVHQHRHDPGHHVGSTLANPDFVAWARSFGIAAERISTPGEIEAALARGLASRSPCLIEVTTSLAVILASEGGAGERRAE
jgi:acetolactate synthase-1/2/3 large subunit